MRQTKLNSLHQFLEPMGYGPRSGCSGHYLSSGITRIPAKHLRQTRVRGGYREHMQWTDQMETADRLMGSW